MCMCLRLVQLDSCSCSCSLYRAQKPLLELSNNNELNSRFLCKLENIFIYNENLYCTVNSSVYNDQGSWMNIVSRNALFAVGSHPFAFAKTLNQLGHKPILDRSALGLPSVFQYCKFLFLKVMDTGSSHFFSGHS